MNTMHAQLLQATAPIAQNPLRWSEIERPTPGQSQVLIEVAACGVCRSNLHMIEGDWLDGGVPAFSPIIPGHEVTGKIVAVGDEVTEFSVGDRVGVTPLWWTCETCEFCVSGREQLCHRRMITGEHVNGGYGEYMIATAAHTFHVPDEVDLVDAAPLFCPGITAYGAVEKLKVGSGDRVAVFGLGGVGHMAIQFASLTGAEVIAVGRNAEHLAVARELGADIEVNTTNENDLRSIAGSIDAVLTFAPADSVTREALRSLKWGGTLVSAVPLRLEEFPFNTAQTIKGSILANRQGMREVLRLAAAGKIRTVVERFAMSEAGSALERLAAGKLRSRAVLVNDL